MLWKQRRYLTLCLITLFCLIYFLTKNVFFTTLQYCLLFSDRHWNTKSSILWQTTKFSICVLVIYHLISSYIFPPNTYNVTVYINFIWSRWFQTFRHILIPIIESSLKNELSKKISNTNKARTPCNVTWNPFSLKTIGRSIMWSYKLYVIRSSLVLLYVYYVNVGEHNTSLKLLSYNCRLFLVVVNCTWWGYWAL